MRVTLQAGKVKYKTLAALYNRIFALDPGLDDIGSTTHTWSDRNSLDRTVSSAGPALHARVPVRNVCLLVFKSKNSMGAYYCAHCAANALPLVKR